MCIVVAAIVVVWGMEAYLLKFNIGEVSFCNARIQNCEEKENRANSLAIME